ncbi:MAG: phage terminase small subunit [Rhizorhabdus sp.]
MSLARKRQETVLAKLSAGGSLSEEGGFTAAIVTGPAATMAAQMKLRLRHDLQRLHQIKSIGLKIAAKREMLPEYAAWVAGLLAAAEPAPGDEVLPTIMIWQIDTGDYEGALNLAGHVLRHNLALPSRYNRDAPSLIVEEIATAAIKVQGVGAEFPLDILERADELTAGRDMHDEIRAKMAKAIGTEYARLADEIDPATPAFAPAAERALGTLRAAHALHDRVGTKDKIRRLERARAKAAPPAAPDTAGTAG